MRCHVKAAAVAALVMLLTLPALGGDGSGDASGAPQRQRKRDGSCAPAGPAVIQNGPRQGYRAQNPFPNRAQGWQCPRGRVAQGAVGAPQRARTEDGSAASPPTTNGGDSTTAPSGPGRGRGVPGMRRGMGPGGGRGMGRGMGMGRNMPEVMSLIHNLLDVHDKVRRDVQDIPGGVLTATTSQDPKVTEMIRTHVRQMKQRMEQGQPIRMWDPLFAELFRHGDKIQTRLEDVAGGVQVTQVSDDPQVTLLIRQHARRGVSEFVSSGWDRVHQPTDLPPGYQPKGE